MNKNIKINFLGKNLIEIAKDVKEMVKKFVNNPYVLLWTVVNLILSIAITLSNTNKNIFLVCSLMIPVIIVYTAKLLGMIEEK